MTLIKFQVTERLERLLLESLQSGEYEEFRGRISLALEERMVPYGLLKSLLLKTTSAECMESLLQGTQITFRRAERAVEPEAVQQARLAAEEAEYLRMVGRTPNNFESTLAAEWDETRRILTGMLNAALSILGTGAAIFVMAKGLGGWSWETALFCATLVAVLVAVAEMYFFLSRLIELDNPQTDHSTSRTKSY